MSLWRSLCTWCSCHYSVLLNLAAFLELKCSWESSVCMLCFLKDENFQRPVDNLANYGTCLCYWVWRLPNSFKQLWSESVCLHLASVSSIEYWETAEDVDMPICSRIMAGQDSLSLICCLGSVLGVKVIKYSFLKQEYLLGDRWTFERSNMVIQIFNYLLLVFDLIHAGS